MDFGLSDDQEALGGAARALLDRHAAPDRVRAHLASGDAYDAGLWSVMAEQGWLGVTLPEKQGGVGLGWVEAAVLAGETGRRVAPVPFVPTLLALATIADGDESAHHWIEPLAEGRAIGAVAWSSRPGAFRAEQAASGDWLLTGRSDPVDAASMADVVVVVLEEAVFAVDLGRVGRPGAQPAMDETRRLSWLELAGAPALRIGGADLARSVADRGALASAAEMLGGAQMVLEMAVGYAKERVQFGQPIGSFQAVKHRCADMLVDVEGMRSAVWFAACCLDGEGDDDPSLAASTAKIWCNDASERVMASGLQVHGGIGFTWEHDLHLYLKRAQLDRQSFGDADHHRTRLASAIRERLEAGVGVI
ncbi:MAG TPA: acyl-CoA dehydrogenase family protein [Acidimicrobiales bacterium]|nr:acyl-CoA dehydrogenase family protein [Acidimicrobiales bacterium]